MQTLVTPICIPGSDRFYLNIEDMIGYKPVFFIKWCWMILTPGICAVSCAEDTQSHTLTALSSVKACESISSLLIIKMRFTNETWFSVCCREFSCFSWLSTNRWSTTMCTPTLTGVMVSAGSWLRPPWSASLWGLSGWSGRPLAPSPRYRHTLELVTYFTRVQH